MDSPAAPGRRTGAIALILAALLLAAGTTVLLLGPGTTDSFGWFAYAPLSDEVFAPGMHFITTHQITGWVLVALAGCAASFWAGLTVARHRH